MVFDSHMDTPTELLRGRDIFSDAPSQQVDLPKLRKGGVDAAFFALYCSAELSPDEATRHALEMVGAVDRVIRESDGAFAKAFSPADIYANQAKGKISLLLGMENASPIQKSLDLLDAFYGLGVRYITLTHNGDNSVADSAAEGNSWGGLSPFGKEVVARMNSLGIMIDLSHASDNTFWDCIELSESPIVATHSCCRSLCSHRRNLTDDMLRALKEKDGYVGINFYPYFLVDDPVGKVPGVSEIVDHIDHAVKLAGLNHVGIGSDYDGIEITPAGLENVGCLPLVFKEMRRRGYSEKDISLISGENLMAVFDRVIKCSKSM